MQYNRNNIKWILWKDISIRSIWLPPTQHIKLTSFTFTDQLVGGFLLYFNCLQKFIGVSIFHQFYSLRTPFIYFALLFSINLLLLLLLYFFLLFNNCFNVLFIENSMFSWLLCFHGMKSLICIYWKFEQNRKLFLNKNACFFLLVGLIL